MFITGRRGLLLTKTPHILAGNNGAEQRLPRGSPAYLLHPSVRAARHNLRGTFKISDFGLSSDYKWCMREFLTRRTVLFAVLSANKLRIVLFPYQEEPLFSKSSLIIWSISRIIIGVQPRYEAKLCVKSNQNIIFRDSL